MSEKRKSGGALPGRGPGSRMGGPVGGVVEKPKNFKETSRKLLRYLAPYRAQMVLVVLFAMASTVFAILGPRILGNVTNDIFEGLVGKLAGLPGGGIPFDAIRRTLLLLLGLYFASSFFLFLQGYIIAGVAQKISYALRRGIAEKINRLPLKYFDHHSHGDVLSRVTNDVDTVSQSLNQALPEIVTSLTSLVGILAMMLSISVPMTLTALLMLPVSTGLIFTIIKFSQKLFKAQQAYLGEANGYVEETFGGHIIVKAFNREEPAYREFSRINDNLYGAAWKSQFLSGLAMPVMAFIGNLGYVAVSILGGYLTVRGIIRVGDIMAFIQYIRRFTQPMNQVAQISNVLQSTIAASERIFEFLEEAELVEESETPTTVDSMKGQVSFHHVGFGYVKGTPVIKDFSLDVQAGQRVAIVGPTGAGKTTLVKLLMRFYELDQGDITIDGISIRDMRRSDLRQNFGMVLQDTWLFSGSILDNIRYSRLEATDEEVMEASRSSYVHHFVKTLPKGYAMEINEEASNVSQGQKQLLTIARVFLKDPRILILDEATSSVDTRTEILIQESMNKLMHGRTSFIIAHRLSTIKSADMILVINEGDIVETGTHEELLEKKGFYEKLYNAQFDE